MKRFGWMIALGLIVAAPTAFADSTGGTGTKNPAGVDVRVFTRTIGGKKVKEAYLIIDRSDDADDYRRRSGKFLPNCRRGLFGRVVNKTACKGRRRSGGISNGKRY